MLLWQLPLSPQSTFLSLMTSTASEAASYEFTTLTCIPGVIEVSAGLAQGAAVSAWGHGWPCPGAAAPEERGWVGLGSSLVLGIRPAPGSRVPEPHLHSGGLQCPVLPAASPFFCLPVQGRQHPAPGPAWDYRGRGARWVLGTAREGQGQLSLSTEVAWL